MTQSSLFGGRRDFDLVHYSADRPIGPYLARDYVANNVMHAADQTCARVLVNDMAADDTYIVDNVDQFATAYSDALYWHPVEARGPFNISVKLNADGRPQPYRLRCAINAASGTGAVAVNYAILVVPGFFLAGITESAWDLSGLAGGTNVCIFGATTSTSPAWLTPAANGYIDVTMDVVSLGERSVIDVPGSTSYVGLATAEIGIVVLAYGSAAPRVYGLHVAEFHA
jgi:hypothetical protein